jgi:hypothetical protein
MSVTFQNYLPFLVGVNRIVLIILFSLLEQLFMNNLAHLISSLNNCF